MTNPTENPPKRELTLEAREIVALFQEVHTNEDERLKDALAVKFYNKILDLVTPQGRMRSGVADGEALKVLEGEDDMLPVGTGTLGQRIYFYPESRLNKRPKWMEYKEPPEDTYYMQHKQYWDRWMDAFGAERVDLMPSDG